MDGETDQSKIARSAVMQGYAVTGTSMCIL